MPGDSARCGAATPEWRYRVRCLRVRRSSARGALPCARRCYCSCRYCYHSRGIRSSRPCGLPAGTLSTWPRISRKTSCREFPSFPACRRWSACGRTAPPSPCPVWSLRAAVKWPIGVLSRNSRSGAGRSADVFVTASRIAAFCMDLKRRSPRRRSARGCAALRLPCAWPRWRPAEIRVGTIRTIGCI